MTSRPGRWRSLAVVAGLVGLVALGVGVAVNRTRARGACLPNSVLRSFAALPQTWNEASSPAAWCTDKHVGATISKREGCAGFNAIVLLGEDGGDAFYYDGTTGKLVGSRTMHARGGVCRGAVPPANAACASKRPLCDRRGAPSGDSGTPSTAPPSSVAPP